LVAGCGVVTADVGGLLVLVDFNLIF
jgi:hypothetical protein